MFEHPSSLSPNSPLTSHPEYLSHASVSPHFWMLKLFCRLILPQILRRHVCRLCSSLNSGEHIALEGVADNERPAWLYIHSLTQGEHGLRCLITNDIDNIKITTQA